MRPWRMYVAHPNKRMQRQYEKLVDELLHHTDLKDPKKVIDWMLRFQPVADHTGVDVNRPGGVSGSWLVVRALSKAGYARDFGVTARKYRTRRSWRARTSVDHRRRHIIGQCMDGIATTGAPHPVLHTFAKYA